jgi:hypothetical protein
MLALGVLLLRRRAGYQPTWRLPLVPVTPILFILVALTIVVNQIRVDVLGAVMGLGIVATGFPAYYLWAKNHEPA